VTSRNFSVRNSCVFLSVVYSPEIFILLMPIMVAFDVFALLVGQQEGQPAGKNLEFWYADDGDLSGAMCK